MTGYDYGNARLRARRAALLHGEDYARLLGRDLPGLIAALAATSYRPQAEAAGAGVAGGVRLGLLYRVARDHLAAAVADVAGFYRDRAAGVVTALLGRFDVHNVLALLRARHHGAELATAEAPLLPFGIINAETAHQAASQSGLPAAARLLAHRSLPDPSSAGALLAASRRYEVDASLAAVEHMVVCSARAHQLRELEAAGPQAVPVVAAFQRETDDENLLLALRLREEPNGQAGRATDHTATPEYVPGGNVPDRQLTTIRTAPARPDVLAAAGTAPRRWQAPLAAWAEGGDLAALHAGIETERLRGELHLLRRADPLGAAVIGHHLLAHEAQARNIRLLAQAAVGVISHDTARRHLVTPI